MQPTQRIKTIGYWLIALMVATLIWPSSSVAADKPTLNHIILISIGGLNQEVYAGNPLPNLKTLALTGASNTRTMAVRADTMEAAEATLLTGALASEHKHLTVNDKVEVESLLDILKRHGKTMLVVDGSGGKLRSFAYGDKEYRNLEMEPQRRNTMETAWQAFDATKPFFSYIYVDDCTQALLTMNQDNYYQAIRNMDDQIGLFIKRLNDNGLYNNCLIVVTSARSSSPSNLVPLIMTGPGCRINYSLNNSMIIDVAPTISYLAGLEPPNMTRGVTLYSTINTSDEARANLNVNLIKDLQKDRVNNWQMIYRQEDEMARTSRQMASIKEEKQSIFDFAGEREQSMIGLRSLIRYERAVFLALMLVMLAGYVIEYRILKKKFLLFK